MFSDLFLLPVVISKHDTDFEDETETESQSVTTLMYVCFVFVQWMCLTNNKFVFFKLLKEFKLELLPQTLAYV